MIALTPPRRRNVERPTPMPPIKYPIRIHPSYVSELRARVEAIGPGAVAKAAGVDRRTVWRQLSGGEGRSPTPSTIEAIRRAVVKLQPNAAPLSPPLIPVRGRVHAEWIALADDVSVDELSREIADIAKRRARRK